VLAYVDADHIRSCKNSHIKAKHLYSWKTLLRSEKKWDAIAQALRANVDVAVTLFRNGAWAV
jgi:hypothetical protein